MLAHRISYRVLADGQGAATCPCGWSYVSGITAVVSKRGQQHVLDAWDREHAA